MDLDIYLDGAFVHSVTLECLTAVDFVEQYVKNADERKRLIVLISGEANEPR